MEFFNKRETASRNEQSVEDMCASLQSSLEDIFQTEEQLTQAAYYDPNQNFEL